MKTGPNDPCPCGSGKKFKKCCKNKPSDDTTLLKSIKFNKLIAYESHIGKERKEWCEHFISWKTNQLKRITDGQRQIAESTGNSITCSKGCWFCCYQHVGASLQECDAIVYWLYQNEDIFNAFLKRYPDWRKSVSNYEDVFHQVTNTGNVAMNNPYDLQSVKKFMQKAEAYAQLKILCPFLEEGTCSIYPVRPFVCAEYVVSSPSEECKPSVDNIPIILKGAYSREMGPPYFRGSKENVIYSPAALLVYQIIVNGFIYLNDLPSLKGIEDEVFNEPRTQLLFKKFFAG